MPRRKKQFKSAREQYTYTQDVTVQTLDGDTVDGQYHQVSDILFDNAGHRIEQVRIRAAIFVWSASP